MSKLMDFLLKILKNPIGFVVVLFESVRHLLAVILLCSMGFLCQGIAFVTKLLVSVLMTGSKKQIAEKQWKFLKENSIGRYDAYHKIALDPTPLGIPVEENMNGENKGLLAKVYYTDESKMLSLSHKVLNTSEYSEFLDPKNLIQKAKEFTQANLGLDDVEKFMTEDFHFIFPVVFLDRKSFKDALVSFPLDLYEIEYCYYGWEVDCFEPNRVWVQTRGWVMHEGERKPLAIQRISVSFCPKEEKVYKLTGGYVIDREAYFDPNRGLGGLFAVNMIKGLYIPVPEMQPWNPTLEWVATTTHVGGIVDSWKNFLGEKKTIKSD